MAKKTKIELIVFSVVLVVLLISLLVYFFSKNEKNLSEKNSASIESDKRSKQSSVNFNPSRGPISVPYTPPSGPQTYRFSHGKDVIGPKIQTMIIDPLDPKKGATQTITLTINSESPITKASIIVYSDSQEKNIDLKLISGDFLKGDYQGFWQVNDTYNNKYALRYIIKAEKNTFDNITYFR